MTKQEPVAWMMLENKLVPIHTAPLQREWQGLTDEEKHYLNEVLNLQGRFPIIDAIEAKLKEKNT
jgi:hypothetical protein